jgi:hypothetical protein
MSPACCRRCSATDDRQWFLDLGYVEEYWGNVYYCDICFKEMASSAKFVSIEYLERKEQNMEVAMRTLTKENEAYAAIVSSLSMLSVDIHDLIDFVRDKKGIGTLDFDAYFRKEPVAAGKSGPTKSSSEQGRLDLPSPDLLIDFDAG